MRQETEITEAELVASLEALDATFCGRLGRSALAWVVKSAPPLRTLVLSVCSHLDAAALEALGTLHTLRLLDLSYTEIQARPPWLDTPHHKMAL